MSYEKTTVSEITLWAVDLVKSETASQKDFVVISRDVSETIQAYLRGFPGIVPGHPGMRQDVPDVVHIEFSYLLAEHSIHTKIEVRLTGEYESDVFHETTVRKSL